jgi:hypothetical protein
MKHFQTHFLFILGLILSCFLPLVSSQSSARARGKRLATDLWNNNNFSCSNIESYIRAAKRLENECTKEFKPSNKFINACKAGVKEVVDEKKKPCVFDRKECERIGKNIGLGIADIICRGSRSTIQSSTFSKKCIRISTNTCKDVANATIEDLLDDGNCGNNNFFTDKMDREVNRRCTSEVKNFATDP